MTEESEAGFEALTLLLQLEAEARNAGSVKALQFLIVNETRRLLPYRQAILFAAGATPRRRMRAEAVSSIAVLDRDTPMLQWVERALHALRREATDTGPQRFDSVQAPESIRGDWREFSLPYVLWTPLRTPRGMIVGGLWLAREEPWMDTELALVQRLAETYAHAWLAVTGQRHWRARAWSHSAAVRWGLVLAMLCTLLVPVRMSTLAPAEIVAKEPTVISAPVDGVIADLDVQPNQTVREGDRLLRFEDTNFRNAYEVAERTLSVTLAEFRKATQGAFHDEKTKAEVALLKAKVELASAERNYAREVLGRLKVKAPRSGLVLYSDKADWIGKPVQTGQRILEIADPQQVQLRVTLPVKDAIAVTPDAEVKVFLDVDPLHPLNARVAHASYRAEVQPDEVLAYRIDAELDNPHKSPVRIGWQGTAKIFGPRVPLFYYLFRRPIAAARQFFGV